MTACDCLLRANGLHRLGCPNREDIWRPPLAAWLRAWAIRNWRGDR
jgi:hypothetical protein